MTDPRVAHLSLAERNRRWQLLRTAMAQRELDCLLVRGTSAKWDSGMANIRYISQIGGNGEEAIAIFPMDRDPVVLIFAPSQHDWWATAQDWVVDVRVGGPGWAAAAVSVLKELGYAHGRIGVVGIGGRTEAGRVMSYDIYREILDALPDARFEPASDILEDARVVKSTEELVLLRKAASLCDVAVETMRAVARPGIAAHEAYGEILGAVLRAGGESPVFMLYEAAPEPRSPLRFPPQRVLQPGDVIVHELSPKYAGYWSHVTLPIVLGKPPPLYRRLAVVARQAYDEAIKTIRAGVSSRRLAEQMNRPIIEAGFTWFRPQWKGVGLEQVENPQDHYFPGALGRSLDMELRENMVLGLQPLVSTPDRRYRLQLGDTVVVTRRGVEHLSHASMELYVV